MISAQKKQLSKIKPGKGDRFFDAVVYILVALVVIVCVYPLYYTVIASFSDPQKVFTGQVIWKIEGFTLEAYEFVFQYGALWRGYRNTIFYTVFGTAYNLFLLIPASYAMSRKELKGKGFFTVYFVFTMYFGGGMIPAYINMKNLGLINTPWAMIIPSAFSVYNMIITRTFFQNSFPDALAEAARIDGASEFRILLQIVLPLSSAIIAVMALYHAVGHWNSYFSAMIYLNKAELKPLQLVLRDVLLQGSNVSIETRNMSTEELMDAARRQRMAEVMKYAVIFIANAPVMIAYPFVQKYFTQGVTIGSIKG